MITKRKAIIVMLVSCILSISLGMMDYETQSLWHLFTSDGGNIIALLFFAMVFTAIGLGLVILVSFVSQKIRVPY